MAIANYEDRFVIPTAHREIDEDAYDLARFLRFLLRQWLLRRRQPKTNLFRGPKRAKTPMEVV